MFEFAETPTGRAVKQYEAWRGMQIDIREAKIVASGGVAAPAIFYLLWEGFLTGLPAVALVAALTSVVFIFFASFSSPPDWQQFEYLASKGREQWQPAGPGREDSV